MSECSQLGRKPAAQVLSYYLVAIYVGREHLAAEPSSAMNQVRQSSFTRRMLDARAVRNSLPVCRTHVLQISPTFTVLLRNDEHSPALDHLFASQLPRAMTQDTLSIRHETDNANLSCKEGFGSPNLTPAGSIQNILKKTGLMQPNLSPVGSIQAEWVDDKPKQQVVCCLPCSTYIATLFYRSVPTKTKN